MSSLPHELLLSLSNKTPDALRAVFAQLGYTPQSGISYSARTLGWLDNAAADLHGRSFDLVASLDDNAFQVLLLPPHPEAHGLPLTLQRRLYSTLAERSRTGVLVLPNREWDLFELVLLVDTRTPEQLAANETLVFPRFSFDPRALQPHHQRALEMMDARGASTIEAEQHVLRAFGRAQQETLFRSQNFFSRHYLEQRIANDGDGIGTTWTALSAETAAIIDAAPADDLQPRSILAALGWDIFTTSTSGLFSLQSGGSAAALLTTLPEGAPIEQQVAGSDYPQLTLIAALEQEKKQKQNGVAWGILTNGRTWRLYSTLTSSISGVYYEIDLHDLLQFGSAEDLRFFTGFFGATGLASGFARKVFYASQTLAKEVGENLKKTIFEQVFEELATGIAHNLWLRGAYTGDEAQRQLIFRATLVLLYRTLFVLYAESRRLLPTMHTAYYPHSLTRLLTDIAIQPFIEPHNKRPMGPKAYWAWEWFNDLCAAVDGGQPSWGVPRYNGGLFGDGQPKHGQENPHDAPQRLLAETKIGALYLVKALDLMGRQKLERGEELTLETARRLIDYAALDVRRLGSIYEGLLEYQLEQDSVDQDGAPTLKLPRSSQGRKASGSYYTPDYIVAYIVEQAVGPVLDKREQRFDALMNTLQARRKELERENAKFNNERISFDITRANVDALRLEVAALEHEASETLLDLKVLDPAMGSGHFLVETVDFLSDRLIAIVQRHKDNPIQTRLAAIRADIRASLRAQGVDAFITDEQLSDARLLRRLVMKRCVYGVDLNDMAVELARLSLWLHSFTVGAPLSFLDHHLKWGNSLIGARAQEVQQAMEKVATGKVAEGTVYTYELFGQDSAFAEMLNLAGLIEELVQIADANGQQVEQSAALYAAYESKVTEVKRLLDLWVSQYFGSKEATQLIRLYSGSRSDVADLVEALMGRRTLNRDGQAAVERALALYQQHRFLHWDLEFPEVFIDLQRKAWKDAEHSGFDAVVGNPPYIPTEDILREEKEFLAHSLPVLYRKYDLSIAFLQQGFKVISSLGSVGMITPVVWETGENYAKFREYNFVQGTIGIKSIINLPFDVFPDAYVDTNVTIFRKDDIPNYFLTRSFESKRKIKDANEIFTDLAKVPFSYIKSEPGAKIYLHQKYYEMLRRFRNSNFINLGSITQACQGIVESFYEYQTDLVSEDYLPYFDFNAYRYNLILLNEKFIKFRESNSLYKFYTQPRILFRRLVNRQDRLMAVYSDINFVVRKDLNPFILENDMDYNLLYILANVNSSLHSYLYVNFSTLAVKDDFRQTTLAELQNLPIRRIAFTTPEAERATLVAEAQRIYAASIEGGHGGPPDRVRGATNIGWAAVPADWRAWREHWRALWAWADARLPAATNDEAPRTNDTSRQIVSLSARQPITEQSDAVHDLLAFLAERMIALNKDKQAEAAQFTAWLERETGTQIDTWKNKTTVQEFWAKDWDAMNNALQKNRGTFLHTQGLKGKNADAALEPLVRATRTRWEQSCAVLAPILAALAATDRLIDLVVYRLYGLADEEIDLVEGA